MHFLLNHPELQDSIVETLKVTNYKNTVKLGFSKLYLSNISSMILPMRTSLSDIGTTA